MTPGSARPRTRVNAEQLRGGRTAAAILAGLTSSCHRHEIDPQVYLTQLLMNLPSWPARDLVAWLPDQWKSRLCRGCSAEPTLRQAARLAALQNTAASAS